MKGKPDTSQFKTAKDPSVFLEGGAADMAARKEQADNAVIQAQAPTKRVQREQKIFRLPIDLINTLKRESYERSMNTGERVTETELVEQALRAFFQQK